MKQEAVPNVRWVYNFQIESIKIFKLKEKQARKAPAHVLANNSDFPAHQQIGETLWFGYNGLIYVATNE